MRNLGGLLATAATAAAIGFADPMLCSIEGEGGEGGGGGGGGLGGAAALLEEEPDAGGGGGGGSGGEGGEGGQGGGSIEVADWMKTFSGDKAEGELSHQEWLAKIGAKDPNDVVARYRQLEKAHRAGGKVAIPGENATEADWAAYREAVGAPKEASGYELTMPDEAKEYEIDTAALDPFREAAFKHGLSASAFKELGAVLVGQMLEDTKAEVATTDADAAAKLKEWGPEVARKKEEFRRGAEFLGVSAAEMQAFQRALGEGGAGRAMDMFQKLGSLAGEDFFAGNGDPSKRFGIANLEQAQAALDRFNAQAGIYDKLKARDPAATAEYNRLTEAVGAFKQREAAKNRG